jgi:hypothetical protein
MIYKPFFVNSAIAVCADFPLQNPCCLLLIMLCLFRNDKCLLSSIAPNRALADDGASSGNSILITIISHNVSNDAFQIRYSLGILLRNGTWSIKLSGLSLHVHHVSNLEAVTLILKTISLISSQMKCHESMRKFLTLIRSYVSMTFFIYFIFQFVQKYIKYSPDYANCTYKINTV